MDQCWRSSLSRRTVEFFVDEISGWTLRNKNCHHLLFSLFTFDVLGVLSNFFIYEFRPKAFFRFQDKIDITKNCLYYSVKFYCEVWKLRIFLRRDILNWDLYINTCNNGKFTLYNSFNIHIIKSPKKFFLSAYAQLRFLMYRHFFNFKASVTYYNVICVNYCIDIYWSIFTRIMKGLVKCNHIIILINYLSWTTENSLENSTNLPCQSFCVKALKNSLFLYF